MKITSTILLTLAVSAVLIGCKKNEPGTANPAAAAPKAAGDAKTATAAKPYPLDVCVVSGEKLGSMGKPYILVYQGQEVKLCCDGCKPDFEKEPAKFIAKLAAKK